MNIAEPRNPMTLDNTDGYTAEELNRLNDVFVEAFNYVCAEIDPDDDQATYQIENAIWDAIAQTDGNLTLVLDRFR